MRKFGETIESSSLSFNNQLLSGMKESSCNFWYFEYIYIYTVYVMTNKYFFYIFIG